MTVRILYFGVIAELLGLEQETISLQKATTVAAFKADILKKYPVLCTMDFRIAVNKEIANPEFSVETGNEVALLPPFAGG